MTSGLAERIEGFRRDAGMLREEIGRIIVGHEEAVTQILVALFAGGHILVQGVPGLGKTLLVRSLAECLSLSFGRVQCTPDLMPADILGTTMIHESDDGGRTFRFERGPVFSHVLLADEINRATPKTQAALLEAMQESAVTAGGERHLLPSPFLLLATQNPIEMEGTYPLPEAQLDRFFFMVVLERPSVSELTSVIRRTTGEEVAAVEKVLDAEAVLAARALARRVDLPEPVAEYAARIVQATHPDEGGATEAVRRFVRYGGSPRAAQTLALAGRVNALLDGRPNASFEDVRRFAGPALRHRIILNFEGEAEGAETGRIVEELVETISEPRA